MLFYLGLKKNAHNSKSSRYLVKYLVIIMFNRYIKPRLPLYIYINFIIYEYTAKI